MTQDEINQLTSLATLLSDPEVVVYPSDGRILALLTLKFLDHLATVLVNQCPVKAGKRHADGAWNVKSCILERNHSGGHVYCGPNRLAKGPNV